VQKKMQVGSFLFFLGGGQRIRPRGNCPPCPNVATCLRGTPFPSRRLPNPYRGQPQPTAWRDTGKRRRDTLVTPPFSPVLALFPSPSLSPHLPLLSPYKQAHETPARGSVSYPSGVSGGASAEIKFGAF